MMAKESVQPHSVLGQIRLKQPLIHHLTNWVTIGACADVVKALGASPVMAHAKEEAGEMAGLASALVLNIGTLTVDFVESMKLAAASANRKGIPVILDVCGAGATKLRDEKCFEILSAARISIIKGNYSEVARIGGQAIKTKGVDSGVVGQNMIELAADIAKKRKCVVVATGKCDIVSDGKKCGIVKNGHEMMSRVVGTGCMAASVIGAFAAVERDLVAAAVSALVCFGIAGECAAKHAKEPASFKNALLDELFNLNRRTIESRQKFEIIAARNGIKERNRKSKSCVFVMEKS